MENVIKNLAFMSLIGIFSSSVALAKPSQKPIFKPGIRVMPLKDMDIGSVVIHPDGTVINFPGKPEIHVGKKGAFDIAYVENDLVVSSKSPRSKTNLFIYLGGRRYTLKLIYAGTGGDQIVSIRDPLDLEIKAEAFSE